MIVLPPKRYKTSRTYSMIDTWTALFQMVHRKRRHTTPSGCVCLVSFFFFFVAKWRLQFARSASNLIKVADLQSMCFHKWQHQNDMNISGQHLIWFTWRSTNQLLYRHLEKACICALQYALWYANLNKELEEPETDSFDL